MPIGSRIGSRLGSRIGSRNGSGVAGVSMAGVARDATSLKYWPQTGAQWLTTLAAASLTAVNVEQSRNWQEASGNIIDVIGDTDLTPFGGAGVSYANAFAGWSTFAAVNIAEGGAAGFLNNTDPALLNPSTDPFTWLMYVAVTSTPLANRTLAIMGNGNGFKLNVTTDPELLGICAATTSQQGAVAIPTTIEPIIITSDPATTDAVVYTPDEVIDVPWTALASAQAIFIGGAVELSAATSIMGDAVLDRALALVENRRLLTALGWSPVW